MTENQRRRKEAIEGYYLNPNICLHCGKVITVGESEQVAAVKKKKFCNRSCGASHNNKVYPKRAQVFGKKHEDVGHCQKCGEEIIYSKQNGRVHYRRKYCDLCLRTLRVKNGNANAWHDFPPMPLEEQSKAEVKRRNHNTSLWFGNRITSHARKAYKASGKPYICKHCGYDLHVDICHIKDIKDFPDSALVKEMNHPDNLVALCKNHHWEFDNGFLKL